MGGKKKARQACLLGILHCREFIYKIHEGIEGSCSSPGLGNCCTKEALSLVTGELLITQGCAWGRAGGRSCIESRLQPTATGTAIQVQRMVWEPLLGIPDRGHPPDHCVP